MARRISEGRRAEGRLVLSNLRLVASVARKVERRFANFNKLSLTFEDLLQEGDIGLVYAIERYDWRKGYRFSTYATYWIRQQMRIKRSETQYRLQNGSQPTLQELSKSTGLRE